MNTDIIITIQGGVGTLGKAFVTLNGSVNNS